MFFKFKTYISIRFKLHIYVIDSLLCCVPEALGFI